jgi:hypothetical protein
MDDRKITLRELVDAVGEFARSDDEVVATVAHLFDSGRVRLGGGLADATIGLADVRTAPRAAAARA